MGDGLGIEHVYLHAGKTYVYTYRHHLGSWSMRQKCIQEWKSKRKTLVLNGKASSATARRCDHNSSTSNRAEFGCSAIHTLDPFLHNISSSRRTSFLCRHESVQDDIGSFVVQLIVSREQRPHALGARQASSFFANHTTPAWQKQTSSGAQWRDKGMQSSRRKADLSILSFQAANEERTRPEQLDFLAPDLIPSTDRQVVELSWQGPSFSESECDRSERLAGVWVQFKFFPAQRREPPLNPGTVWKTLQYSFGRRTCIEGATSCLVRIKNGLGGQEERCNSSWPSYVCAALSDYCADTWGNGVSSVLPRQ